MQENDTFLNYGFLSHEAEAARASTHADNLHFFQNMRQLSKLALDNLDGGSVCLNRAYWAGLGLWARTIEAAQGATILFDRGMPSSALPVVRTGLECLFYACALWRNPGRIGAFESNFEAERDVQIRAMLETGKNELSPTHLADLAVLRDDSGGGVKWSAFDAAKESGLLMMYQTHYRGLSFAGAHASMRSLDDYIRLEDGEGPQIAFHPRFNHQGPLLGTVIQCLTIGIERHREVLATLPASS